MRLRSTRAVALSLALMTCGCGAPSDGATRGAETPADPSVSGPGTPTVPPSAVAASPGTPGSSGVTYADPDVLMPDPYPEGPAGTPVCGYPLTPLPPTSPTVPPPTDECLFTGMSPSCPSGLTPTEVVDNGMFRAADPSSTITSPFAAGF